LVASADSTPTTGFGAGGSVDTRTEGNNIVEGMADFKSSVSLRGRLSEAVALNCLQPDGSMPAKAELRTFLC
jgi:hypothetical protein